MRTPAARREAMLELVLLAAAEESVRPFPEPVVELMRQVVPCDTAAYRAWDGDGLVDESYAGDDLSDRLPYWTRYAAFRHEDPHPSEPVAGGAPPVSATELLGRPLVLRRAVGDRQLRRTGLYCELMRPLGVRDVLKVFLPPQGDAGSVIVLDTSRHGFDDLDCELLARLVPALTRFERNARLRDVARSERFARLTPRELTVLGRVAAGESNAEIAAALMIGASTVRKHLAHVYEKLEVRNRASAAVVYSREAGGRADA